MTRVDSASPSAGPLTYAKAGVDIAAGDAFVDRIKPAAAATYRPGVMAGIGGFAAAFDLKTAGWSDPILLATTDGVGTKLDIAAETGLHDGIGQDLVAMCVNDLLAQGGTPLFFLDYFATGKLAPVTAAIVVESIARACAACACALVGGETAEMPGMYGEGRYDLAGFAIGAVERGALLPRRDAMAPGDVLIGLASSGVHSNGFSLVRAIVARTGLAWSDPAPWDGADGAPLGAALLTPTRLYPPVLRAPLAAGYLLGLAHITGGGLIGNAERMLPPGLDLRIDWQAWRRPALFDWLQGAGNVPEDDMRQTFNLGIGMVAIVKPQDKDRLIADCARAGVEAVLIGDLIAQ